jgi:catechol 2,3-dioxygenase
MKKADVPIHPSARIGSASLKVADLSRSLDFYTKTIGLKIYSQDRIRTHLGTELGSILSLEELPAARRPSDHSTGLYHAAILFPDRRSLAIKISQLIDARIPFGQSDHLVSEAFYLSDPDGNGLELYRDRPKSEWVWQDEKVQMAIDPIDFNSFFSEIFPGEPALDNSIVPQDTRMGHIHLRVADIEIAQHFYHQILGFDVTASMPGALFLSAGGYHHHLAMNVWQSRRGLPPEEPAVGLREFSILLPDAAELERIGSRIEDEGISIQREGASIIVIDPFGIQVRLVADSLLTA